MGKDGAAVLAGPLAGMTGLVKLDLGSVSFFVC
jgi:hypothetical protein